MKKIVAMFLATAMMMSIAACSAPSSSTSGSDFEQNSGSSSTSVDSSGTAAQGSYYKGKNITVNIPGSAGGGTDIPTRLFFAHIDKELGCVSVPTNLNAAGGVVCYTQTAQAKADGLTIACTSCPVFLSSYLTGDLTCNPKEDYEYIGGITENAQVICVSSNSEWETLDQVITYSKDHPEDLCWEGTGAAGVKQLVRISLSQASGASFRTLDTDGDNDIVVDLMGGHIDIAAISISTAATYIQSGDLRALAITSSERAESLPDVPTVAELGYEIPIGGTTQIFITPKGVDAAVLKEMQDAFAAVSVKEEWIAEAKDHNLTPAYLSPEETLEYVSATLEFLESTGLY